MVIYFLKCHNFFKTLGEVSGHYVDQWPQVTPCHKFPSKFHVSNCFFSSWLISIFHFARQLKIYILSFPFIAWITGNLDLEWMLIFMLICRSFGAYLFTFIFLKLQFYSIYDLIATCLKFLDVRLKSSFMIGFPPI